MSPRLETAARHSAAELRRLARHERDRRAAMRMIAIAESLDGADRETAARRGDMSDQALRDAIKRYNAEGIEGLHDRPRAGRPTKLSEAQRSELRAMVVKGPDVEAEGLSAYTRDDPRQDRRDQVGRRLRSDVCGPHSARARIEPAEGEAEPPEERCRRRRGL